MKVIMSKWLRRINWTLVFIFISFLLALLVKSPVQSQTEPDATNTVIAQSSIVLATGPSTMRHLVRTSDGTLHVFIQLAKQTVNCPTGIGRGLVWLYSTDSGATWSCGAELMSHRTIFAFASAVVDSSDNIYVVYSQATSGAGSSLDVIYRKLTKGVDSTWILERRQRALIAAETIGYHYATLDIENSDRLWLATRYFDGTNYQVSVYYSDSLNPNPVWTASQVTLDKPDTSINHHYPSLVSFGSKIGVIYNSNAVANQYRWRSRRGSDPLDAWTDEEIITDSNVSLDPNYTTTVDAEGNVFLAWNTKGTASFTAYNGVWSTPVVLSSTSSTNLPASVVTDGTNAYVFYAETHEFISQITGSRRLVYKKGIPPFGVDNFDAEGTNVIAYHDIFDSVWSYMGGTYVNETIDAGDYDMTNTEGSGVGDDVQMLKNGTAGQGTIATDILYFGKTQKFDAVSWALTAQVGVGGTIAWEYWNGSDWAPLVYDPAVAPNFGNDGWLSFYDPADWAQTSVNGEANSYYYVRARVIDSYETFPVGAQFNSLPEVNWINFISSTTTGTGQIFGIWTENARGPTKIRFANPVSF